jgi:hypothetical protein
MPDSAIRPSVSCRWWRCRRTASRSEDADSDRADAEDHLHAGNGRWLWAATLRDLPQRAAVGEPTVQTRYAKSGDVHIAYQATAERPVDVVLVQGWETNIDLF